MKVFRIVRWLDKYRVDQLHRVMYVFKYWDRGASALRPVYCFNTPHDAMKAIRNAVGDKAVIYVKVDKFIYYE